MYSDVLLIITNIGWAIFAAWMNHDWSRFCKAKVKECEAIIETIGAHTINQIGGHKMIKCSICGEEFEPGTRPDGLPNGVGFKKEDGEIVNVCTGCLIKRGSELEKDGK